MLQDLRADDHVVISRKRCGLDVQCVKLATGERFLRHGNGHRGDVNAGYDTAWLGLQHIQLRPVSASDVQQRRECQLRQLTPNQTGEPKMKRGILAALVLVRVKRIPELGLTLINPSQ